MITFMNGLRRISHNHQAFGEMVLSLATNFYVQIEGQRIVADPQRGWTETDASAGAAAWFGDVESISYTDPSDYIVLSLGIVDDTIAAYIDCSDTILFKESIFDGKWETPCIADENSPILRYAFDDNLVDPATVVPRDSSFRPSHLSAEWLTRAGFASIEDNAVATDLGCLQADGKFIYVSMCPPLQDGGQDLFLLMLYPSQADYVSDANVLLVGYSHDADLWDRLQSYGICLARPYNTIPEGVTAH